MRELHEHLRSWIEAGTPFALATVVGVQGSAPRGPGATMAVGADGQVAGSISGGCVESAVYDLASSLLPDRPAVLSTFGISDEDAFAVGLTCGGVLDVLVQPRSGAAARRLDPVLDSLARDEPVALASVVEGEGIGRQLAVWADRVEGSLGSAVLDLAVTEDARVLLAEGTARTRQYGPAGERDQPGVGVFVQPFTPAPRLIVFGAVDLAGAVARLGRYLGYHVTVCDARAVFATEKRFPDADEVVCDWPHRYLAGTRIDAQTVVCVLTHDPKFDVPVLEVALRSPARYVGAMGSRRTHANRVQRLIAAGVGPEEMTRLSSPIGLDLGARSPEETAVSILADVIRLRWGGTGAPLAGGTEPIHRPAPTPT